MREQEHDVIGDPGPWCPNEPAKAAPGWWGLAKDAFCIVGLFALAVLLAYALTFTVTGVKRARSADNGQFANVPDYIRQWFREVKVPGTGMSCCGEADAYWADKVETEHLPDGQSRLIAIVTDDRTIPQRRPIPVGTRYIVPPERIAWKHGNPTGHIVIFLNINDQVLCYVQNGGV